MVAIYACEPDFDLENPSENQMYCSNENWIGTPPVCVGKGGIDGIISCSTISIKTTFLLMERLDAFLRKEKINGGFDGYGGGQKKIKIALFAAFSY